MAINIDIVNSTIISVYQDSNSPRYYFGALGTSGKFYPSSTDDNGVLDGLLIVIGGDDYQVKWNNLVIAGTSPTSLANAQSLLATLFSTL